MDANLDITGQSAALTMGWPSWKGLYAMGSTSDLVSLPQASLNISPILGAVLGGNITGNGTAGATHSIGLAWCGTGFAETGTCIGGPYDIGGPDIAFSYIAGPSSTNLETAQDFSKEHASWVGTIELNALNALRNAFAKVPVIVELASSHTSLLSTQSDQEHLVGVVGGWPAAGTGQLLDLRHSAVYYWPILANAQIAAGYPSGSGPACNPNAAWCDLQPAYPPSTPTDVASFQKIMAAFGTGIGNSAAHELGHQFQSGPPLLLYMDCGNGGTRPCENNDNFVYEFFAGSGLPQDPNDSSGTGAQFKYLTAPGTPPIHWGLYDACSLKRFFLNNVDVSCDKQ